MLKDIPKKENKDVAVSFVMTQELKQKIWKEAKKRELKPSELMRHVLDKGIDEMNK